MKSDVAEESENHQKHYKRRVEYIEKVVIIAGLTLSWVEVSLKIQSKRPTSYWCILVVKITSVVGMHDLK